jgi:hypothetical protein
VSVTTAEPVARGPADAPGDNGVAVGRPGAWWILIAGVIGLTASATLLIEKIEMLKNPAYVPSCSINPVLSCGSVMVRPEASAFGFPNPLIGVEKIKEAFDTTFRAMDAMDSFRSKAIETMGRNNEMMREQVARAETYLDKVRGEKAREALKGSDISGPVAL